MSSSLFRDDSDSDDLLVEPPAKKSRHFKPEVDSDSDIEIEENVGGSSIKASLKVEQIKSVDWETKYFGGE